MSLWLGILGASGLISGGDFEAISSVTVGSGGASSIEFTSIPSTYQHLQIRLIGRYADTGSSGLWNYNMRLNGNDSALYISHQLRGNGTSALPGTSGTNQTSFALGNQSLIPRTNELANVFGASIIDILDYANTSKNRVIRNLSGVDLNGVSLDTVTTGNVHIESGLFRSTTAVSSVTLFSIYNWAQHSTAALYGVKAP